MVSDSFAHLRKSQFARLDAANQVYLDYTGAALYPRRLVDQQQTRLQSSILGNPHSHNPTSNASTSLISHTRHKILHFFRASPDYVLIFTANATAAVKLVAEAFPFSSSSTLALLADNHNSVHGIRQFARHAAASVRYIPLDSHLRARHLSHFLSRSNAQAPNLFVYPAQSNFSGVRHSLSYISCAHARSWTVLLDAAAYVPTSPLDLSAVSPDFVAMSFYKMFGMPTGVGALIAKRSALAKLKRPWFAGGTVRYAAVANQAHALADSPTAFEDGTPNFLAIATVSDGFDFLSSVGMSAISQHVTQLAEYTLHSLLSLSYPNHSRVIKLYGPHSMRRRGATFAFDVLRPDRSRVNPEQVEQAASRFNISLRSGCFCNPGAAEHALRRDPHKERVCIKRLGFDNLNTENMSNCLGQPLGCVRISLGIPSNQADVDALIRFLRNFSHNL